MAIGDWSEEDVKNGLRTETGALVGGLNVFDYLQGRQDFKAGSAPPTVTSASYDLGRRRASEEAEAKADFEARLGAEDAERDRRMRELLKDHPVQLAEYERAMADLRAKK